jgi:fumarylacetoacetate (FAA) hydrolase
MLSHRSGQLFGRPDTGTDLRYDMATLVAHAAKTRALAAGSILGSGAVANREASGLPKPVADGGVGHSCIAELRAVETMASGRPETPFLKFGDVVRIEMLDRQGRSIFGAIEQTVRRYVPSA